MGNGPQHHLGKAAGPLELLHQHGGKGVRAVTVRLGIDGERTLPARRIEQVVVEKSSASSGPIPPISRSARVRTA